MIGRSPGTNLRARLSRRGKIRFFTDTAASKVTFNAVAGRTYHIAVDGRDGAAGNIALKVQMHAKAPTNVRAIDGTFTDKVRVTWDAVAGATSYEVWRSTTNRASTATKIATVTATTFDDTTAVAGRTYFYFVKAKSAVGASDFSGGNSGHRKQAPPPWSVNDRDNDKDKDRDDDDGDDDDDDND